MVPSRVAAGVGRALASVEVVWASAFWQIVICGLLAATLGGILFMKLGRKLRVPMGHLASPIINNWLQVPDKHKVNDHIYELYRPEGDLQPAMEILFFHGLQFGPSQHAYLSTWMSPGDGSIGEHVWPATWLAEEFPNARILSMSYDSSMRRTPEQGRSDLFNVAENLINAICLARIGQEFRRPVILVGHSFGGLVIKKLCIEANRIHSQRPDLKNNQMIKEFLHNVGGVFFYGTPHHGSALGSMASLVLDGPLLTYVERLNTESARLHKDFCDVCINNKIWRIAGVGELLATRRGPFYDVVVPEASARYGEFSTVQEDHISLCKPAAKTSNNFQLLTDFIRSIVPKEGAYFENRQCTPKAAVGLDLLVEDVEGKLKGNSRLGMVGMGGVGKSTLAMAVFNKLGPAFEYSCFVPDVKVIAREEETLMKKELWKRMHFRGKMVADPNREDWSQLRGKTLLLVLDDAAKDRDLKILLEIRNLLDMKEDVDSGSRFIVTSRNSKLLSSFQDDIYVYRVQGLTKMNAKKLFMSHAFPKQAVLPVAFEHLVDSIVEKCDGLPLTLEVLGNYLKRSKDDKIWEQTLKALDEADGVAGLDEKLWAKLRLSYTGLSTEEQQMFLDATTFFSHNDDDDITLTRDKWTLREAKAAWSVAYGYEELRWQSLVDMSLVYDCNQDESIKVHEQLQSLGRKIASDANQDGKCFRAWKRREGLKLLHSTDRSSNQEFHSLRLQVPKEGQVAIPRSYSRRFKKLQYLELFGMRTCWRWLTLDGPEENVTVPTDLVLLRSLDLQFAQVFLDPALLPRLAVLKLSDYDLEYLPNSIGHLSALKIFHLEARKLKILPDEFGDLAQLERLELYCERLQTLPETFGNLSSLKNLAFRNPIFHTLPNSFGRLSKLQHLEFYSCYNLQSLPESFEVLSSLEHLCFLFCNLHVLPESFGRLPALKRLEFFECDSLQCLPESFGQLPVLKFLDLSYCHNLQCLPESFGQLPVLKFLDLSYCLNLQCLPESFVRLPALKELKVFGCRSLQSLPESFGQLTTLRHLSFGDTSFRSLPESFGQLLSVLEHLQFDSCTNLQSLPDSMGRLSSLRHLAFRKCDNLHTLPGCQFPNLQELTVSYCRKIDSLPFSPGQLKALHHLKIRYTALGKIPDWIKSLPLLQSLELGWLPCLEGWPRWLGLIPLDLAATSWKFSHTQGGQFDSLESKDVLDVGYRLDQWIYANAMDKMKALDYGGAITDLQRALGVLGPYRWQERQFIWQERGIVKRYSGDLDGALEDFTLALKEGDNHFVYEVEYYNCRKHRGYVKYMLGDEEGAREDGKEALKHLKHLVQEGNTELNQTSLSLGDESVSYLEFKLTGWKEMMELIESSHMRAMEKVRASDFDGALAEFETVEARLLELSPFLLRERGICKWLVGDLDGALEDLTLALKRYDDLDYGVEYYNCRKHRGYVKYLLGDEEGAREDGKEALKQLKHLVQEGNTELNQTSLSLGDESVSYLEFKLTGWKEMMELVESSHLRAMEKVRASDFNGALAEFEAVEAIFSELTLFFLQERGICKRLVGDLVGALKDLTAALELTWKEGEDDYECRKHRGFVKYLLGDLDGAREDANQAMAIGAGSSYWMWDWSDEWEVGHRNCLGVDPIRFLEFKLE